MNVVGLDLSMTATGVAYSDGRLGTWSAAGAIGDQRLIHYGEAIDLLLTLDVDLAVAVIEDLPFNARAAGVTGLVHGVIRLALARRGVPVVLVAPATLKVYATGTGKATKPDMRMSLYKRTGLDMPDDNQVDAAWLRYLGHDLMGEPLLDLPKTHRRALDKVTKPDLYARRTAQ